MSDPMLRYMTDTDDRLQRMSFGPGPYASASSVPRTSYYAISDRSFVDPISGELEYLSGDQHREPSIMSSSEGTQSTTVDSVFDRSTTPRSYRKHWDLATQTSIAPSQRSHHLAPDLAWTAQQAPQFDNALPCEFAGYTLCDVSFHPDEIDLWIEHTITHLQNRLPPKCVCWFCDDVEFNSQRPGHSLRSNFDERMEHIRQHIIDEGKSIDDIRPDFHLLEHLDRYQLISKDMYNEARRYDERPYAQHVLPHSFEVPERVHQTERRNQVHHNQSKEDRDRRRHHGSSRRHRH